MLGVNQAGFSIATNGDYWEKVYWQAFASERFPSYELRLPPEQPSDDRAEELARRAAAVVGLEVPQPFEVTKPGNRGRPSTSVPAPSTDLRRRLRLESNVTKQGRGSSSEPRLFD
jgi:hypothetical protein